MSNSNSNSNSNKISRRTALRVAFAALLGSASQSVWSSNKRTIALTPAQTEGPFYPVQEQADKDPDLTLIEGRKQRAQGDIIEVSGYVVDRQGKPVSDALVDIWQANKWGRYNHSKDPSNAPLDANFQGWAQLKTDKKGAYRFKTIMPGSYPASPMWTRPPHIHFKVSVKGVELLTTQMYFAGNPHNADDQILSRLTFSERSQLIVELKNSTDTEGNAIRQGQFDIVIRQMTVAHF